ncbi:MAG: cation transporter [Actinomycetota bacterium]
MSEDRAALLRRRGFGLEFVTLGWNAVGVVVLAVLAAGASSVALVGFGLDSLIEIGASIVVIWELSGSGAQRRQRALHLIGVAFAILAVYLFAQSSLALLTAHRATPGIGGIAWTGSTALVMFVLAFGKRRTGRELGNTVLETEARVTFIDGILAVAVLAAVVLDASFGWWMTDAIAGYVIVFYAAREAMQIFREERSGTGE